MTGLILLPTDRLPSPHPEAPPWRGPGRDTALCGRFRDACCGARLWWQVSWRVNTFVKGRNGERLRWAVWEFCSDEAVEEDAGDDGCDGGDEPDKGVLLFYAVVVVFASDMGTGYSCDPPSAPLTMRKMAKWAMRMVTGVLLCLYVTVSW